MQIVCRKIGIWFFIFQTHEEEREQLNYYASRECIDRISLEEIIRRLLKSKVGDLDRKVFDEKSTIR